MTDPLLRVAHVTRVYGDGSSLFTALDQVTFTIDRGESVAIVGKSGSGKSTLMHLMALLDAPTSGEIYLNGRDVTHLSPTEIADIRNKMFGFVFQQFFLLADDSVLDNVALPLTIAGVPKPERNSRAMTALEKLGMASKASNRANDLSGGQKQRTVIARALINEPEVIFADEPTGNLDSATGKVVVDSLFDLHRQQDITLVIVTHDPDLAARCDRIITIQDGRIASDTKTKGGVV